MLNLLDAFSIELFPLCYLGSICSEWTADLRTLFLLICTLLMHWCIGSCVSRKMFVHVCIFTYWFLLSIAFCIALAFRLFGMNAYLNNVQLEVERTILYSSSKYELLLLAGFVQISTSTWRYSYSDALRKMIRCFQLASRCQCCLVIENRSSNKWHIFLEKNGQDTPSWSSGLPQRYNLAPPVIDTRRKPRARLHTLFSFSTLPALLPCHLGFHGASRRLPLRLRRRWRRCSSPAAPTPAASPPPSSSPTSSRLVRFPCPQPAIAKCGYLF